MKNFLFSSLIFAAISLSASQYQQTFIAEFDSPADAKSANASIQLFPDNKKIAFSTRWDDTNPRHLEMAKMLNKHGLFATCYIVGAAGGKAESDMVRGVLSLGGAVGSHTLTHPFLETLIPNKIFTEIVLERILLESKFDTNVVSFVLPYCSSSSPLDDNVRKFIGHSIISAGYLVSPEPYQSPQQRYWQDCGILTSHTFGINDRNPDAKMLVKQIANAREKFAKGFEPHLTLGIHTWQSDEGLARLGSYIDANKSDDFWYCNENDYAAYRSQFLNSKIEKISVNGNSALFRLTRPAATNLGSDIPLSVKFSVKPKSISAERRRLTLKGDTFDIPHSLKMRSPKQIDHIAFDGKNGKMASSKKFPELLLNLKLDEKTNSLAISAVKKGKAKIENFKCAFVLPPCYNGAGSAVSTEFLSGAPWVARINLQPNAAKGAENFAEAFKSGDMLLAARCDFLFNGKPARVWLTTVKKQPVAASDGVRDKALHLGDFDNSLCNRETIAKMSKTGAPLKEIGVCKWKFRTDNSLREFMAAFDGYVLMKKYPKGNLTYLICAEFEAPANGNYTFYTSPSKIERAYLNGRQIENLKSANVVDLKKGRNRIIIELGEKSLRAKPIIMAVKDGDAFLKCVTPNF